MDQVDEGTVVDVIDHLFHVCHATGADGWVRSAYVTLSLPVMVICGVFYAIYWWDYHLMLVGIGVIINVTLGIILKEILRVPRRLPNCGVGYSMPSLHTFLATYLVVYFSYLFFEASLRTASKRESLRLWVRIAVACIYLFWISSEKISIGHNTWYDVTMGWILGIPYAFGVVYFISRILINTEETYLINEDKTD